MTQAAARPAQGPPSLPSAHDADTPWSAASAAARDDAPPRSQVREAIDAFLEQPLPRAAAIVFGVLVAGCIAGPWVLPWGPTEMDVSLLRAQGPTLAHPLGTDQLGRDQLVRLLHAGRISLLIGLLVATLSVSIGALMGGVAGYFGGRIDTTLMWIVTVLMSIPALPLLIALSVLVASPSSRAGALVRALPETGRIVLVMCVLGWLGTCRVVRSKVLSMREREYVEAARATGAGHARILLQHVLPNCVPILVVFTTLGIGGAIMGESFLSFLGMGVNPPTPTWGNMINQSIELSTILNHPHLTIAPSLAILITILSVNFMGEGMRVALEGRR